MAYNNSFGCNDVNFNDRISTDNGTLNTFSVKH